MRELLQQGRLAHTRLTFEQDEPAFTATRLRRNLGQCIQRRLPLEQCHSAGALLRRVRLDKRKRGIRHTTSSVLAAPTLRSVHLGLHREYLPIFLLSCGFPVRSGRRRDQLRPLSPERRNSSIRSLSGASPLLSRKSSPTGLAANALRQHPDSRNLSRPSHRLAGRLQPQPPVPDI